MPDARLARTRAAYAETEPMLCLACGRSVGIRRKDSGIETLKCPFCFESDAIPPTV